MEELTLLRDLSLIWLAALVAGYISVWLRQSLVAGFILIGVAIGPFGLKLIQDIHNIQVLSELGVALLLFGLGVEFSLKQIATAGHRLLSAGLLQLLLTTGGAWFLLNALGGTANTGTGFVFGVICALSSTVVATKVLADRGESDSLHGRIAIPILLFQDLSLVPIMALLPTMTDSSNSVFKSNPILTLLLALLFIGAIIVAATKIVPRLLKGTARANSRELFLLTIIVLCVGIAVVSHYAGLSLALGAFLAGLMISEYPYGHQALSDVRPLRDLFSTVFFVSIGMYLDPAYIIQHPVEVTGFVLLLMVGKAITGTLASLAATGSVASAILSGVALCQIGEFSFVLAEVAHDGGLLPRSLFNLFLAGAVVTMVLTPSVMAITANLVRRLNLPWDPDKDHAFLKEETDLSKMKDHVIICGYGRTGTQLVHALRKLNIPLLIIEADGHVLEQLEDDKLAHIYGDAFSPTVLTRANLSQASALVVTISDPIAERGIISFAHEHAPHVPIIARAHRFQEQILFKKAGAKHVVQPEFEAGVQMTRLVLETVGIAPEAVDAASKRLRNRASRFGAS